MRIKTLFLILLSSLVTLCSNLYAQSEGLPVISAAAVDSIAHGQVIWNGRVAPMGTLCNELVTKLYGKPSYKGLSATQVIASWVLRPEEWSKQPIIKLKNESTARVLGVNGRYASMQDFFDEKGNYKIKADDTERGLVEADEKAGLVLSLLSGRLMEEVPEDMRISDTKVSLELIYNAIPWSMVGMICCFLMSLLAFFRYGQLSCIILSIWIFISMAWRSYLSGFMPVSNSYETLMLTTWGILTVGALSPAKYKGIHIGALLASGCLLMVAHLLEMNPYITPLMPALHSPWLNVHVSTVMMSYSLFTLLTALGIYGLCVRDDERKAQVASWCHICLCPATLLLGVGIIFGSIWAKTAWGSYWSWDPKETWALITFIIYMMLHLFKINSLRKKNRMFLTLTVCAYISVLITWFGVNYFLGGMHSYAH